MAGKRTKNNVYVVDVGGSIREFDNWPACQAFVNGTPHAFAGGVDRAQAMAKLRRSRGAQQRHHRARADGPGDSRPASRTSTAKGPRPTAGICADAGTHGNPGPSEYQVCDLAGTVLEHRHLGVHSNNYAELAGIAAMVEHALEHGHRLLWTDSKIAMGWIASGRVGATVHERELVVAMAQRIGQRLSAHPELELCKWHTKAWGEIPADFGRK